ncbi:hypothetical protein CW304_14670 [Bacillus sp. UFRGS-B20]|nr:hypothetical protein CW304_14670 [Bacillus sp. UFRGS-B20]
MPLSNFLSNSKFSFTASILAYIFLVFNTMNELPASIHHLYLLIQYLFSNPFLISTNFRQ